MVAGNAAASERYRQILRDHEATALWVSRSWGIEQKLRVVDASTYEQKWVPLRNALWLDELTEDEAWAEWLSGFAWPELFLQIFGRTDEAIPYIQMLVRFANDLQRYDNPVVFRSRDLIIYRKAQDMMFHFTGSHYRETHLVRGR